MWGSFLKTINKIRGRTHLFIKGKVSYIYFAGALEDDWSKPRVFPAEFHNDVGVELIQRPVGIVISTEIKRLMGLLKARHRKCTCTTVKMSILTESVSTIFQSCQHI